MDPIKETCLNWQGRSGAFCIQVLKTVCSLRDRYLFWSDEKERRVLLCLTYEEFGFPHCVGIADGTLCPLAFEPDSEDAPCHSRRKHRHPLTVISICDPNKKIHCRSVGHCGCAHDNQVCDAATLKKKPEDHVRCNASLVTVPLQTVIFLIFLLFQKVPKVTPNLRKTEGKGKDN